MKKIIVLSFYIIIAFFNDVEAQKSFKTIVLVRHAEKQKDGTKNPGLTQKGIERAERLADLLTYQKFDRFYTTDYERTRSTLLPLANENRINLDIYPAEANGEYFDKLLESYNLTSIVICGHSNTIPRLINHWIKEIQLPDLQEDEYDKVFIIHISPSNEASLVILKF